MATGNLAFALVVLMIQATAVTLLFQTAFMMKKSGSAALPVGGLTPGLLTVCTTVAAFLAIIVVLVLDVYGVQLPTDVITTLGQAQFPVRGWTSGMIQGDCILITGTWVPVTATVLFYSKA